MVDQSPEVNSAEEEEDEDEQSEQQGQHGENQQGWQLAGDLRQARVYSQLRSRQASPFSGRNTPELDNQNLQQSSAGGSDYKPRFSTLRVKKKPVTLENKSLVATLDKSVVREEAADDLPKTYSNLKLKKRGETSPLVTQESSFSGDPSLQNNTENRRYAALKSRKRPALNNSTISATQPLQPLQDKQSA